MYYVMKMRLGIAAPVRGFDGFPTLAHARKAARQAAGDPRQMVGMDAVAIMVGTRVIDEFPVPRCPGA
jgi:hypothetical protein